MLKIKIKRSLPPSVKKALDHIQAKKKYGEVNTLQNLMKIDTISTGSLGLDLVTGGGNPLGHVVELRGEEGVFKTTLSLEMLKSVQDANYKGGSVAFIDVEQTLNPKLAIDIGLDPNRFIHVTPDTGEDAFSAIHDLARSGVGGVVLDSVGAITPEEDMGVGMGQGRMGSQARLMWKAYRQTRGAIYDSNILAVFINQRTVKMGDRYGAQQSDSKGGSALKFWSFLRLDMMAGKRITAKGDDEESEDSKKKDIAVGQVIHVYCFKNKMASPFRKAEIPMIFGSGIDKDADLLKVCVDLKIVKKSGAWLAMPDGTKVSGVNAFKDYLHDHKKECKVLTKRVQEAISS
jgi:recombination protein RecA